MADRSVLVSDTIDNFRLTYNLTSSDVGDVATLNTTASTLVTSINELHGEINTNTAAIGTIASLNAAIKTNNNLVESLNDFYTDYTTYTGFATALNTTASSLSTAINELHGEINTNTAAIGTIANLHANIIDSANLVSSVNNFYTDYTTYTGFATALNTTATSLSTAINEIHGEFNTLNAYVTQGTLNTTATNVTAAVNELHGEINTNATAIGTIASLNAAIKTGNNLVASVNDFYTDYTTYTGFATALDTTATSLSTAINELHGEINTNATAIGTIASLNAAIKTGNNLVASVNDFYTDYTTYTGFATALNTTATSLSTAINELHGEINASVTSIGTIANINAAIKTNNNLVESLNDFYTDYTTYTGFATALNTTATSLSTAINEIHGEFNTLDAFASQGTLNTTATTLRGAINELLGTTATTELQRDAETLKAVNARVGLLSALDGAFADANDDTVVAAINYVLGLAQAEDTSFANPVSFSQNVSVGTNLTVSGNLDVTGAFTFDGGGVAISSILDQDTMSSNSATALATQQSIKAYVDNTAAAIDAITLDGIDSTGFLRSSVSDTINSNLLTYIGSGSGSAYLTHNSTTNLFSIVPNTGIAYDAGRYFGFDGDQDYWKFADKLQVNGELDVNGTLNTLGITDSATTNKFTVTDSKITNKTATDIQGTLTLTTGLIALPTNSSVGNSVGEYIDIDGTNNEVSLVAASTEGVRVTGTAVDLRYASAVKLATTSGGISVTGNIVGSGNISTSSATLQVNGNSTNQRILWSDTSSFISVYAGNLLSLRASATAATLYYAGSTKLATSTTGVSITGNAVVSGDVSVGTTGKLHNTSGEGVVFTGTSLALQVGSSSILSMTGSAITANQNLTVNGNITATGTVNGTFNISTLTDLTVDSLTIADAVSSLTLPTTGEIDNGGNEKIAFTAATIGLFANGVKRLDVTATGAAVTGDLSVSGNITGTITQTAFGNITAGTIGATGLISGSAGLSLTGGDIQLPTTGIIHNGSTEKIEFEASTIDFYTSNGLDFRVGSSTSNFYGILNVAGSLQADGGIVVIGDTQVPLNGSILNGGGEKIIFTGTTAAEKIIFEIGNAEKLRVDSAGIDVTGAFTSTGSVTSGTDFQLATTGKLHNNSGEEVVFTGTTVDVKTASVSRGLFSSTGLAVTGLVSTTGNLQSGADVQLATTGKLHNAAGEEVVFTGTTVDVKTANVSRGLFSSTGLAVTGIVSSTGIIDAGTDFRLSTTGKLHNNSGEEVVFTGTTVDIKTTSISRGLFSSTGLAVTGLVSSTGNLQSGADVQLAATGKLHNASGEEVVFTGTTVDIKTASASRGLFSSTGLNVTGSVVASANVTAYSDIHLKDDIKKIDNALDKIMLISGVTYVWNDVARSKTPELPTKRFAGVLAQEVNPQLPEVVSQVGEVNGNPILGVDYNGLEALIIEAIKELKTEIDEIKKRLP